MYPYRPKCHCGTEWTHRDYYRKCSQCGNIEVRGEEYDLDYKKNKLKPKPKS